MKRDNIRNVDTFMARIASSENGYYVDTAVMRCVNHVIFGILSHPNPVVDEVGRVHGKLAQINWLKIYQILTPNYGAAVASSSPSSLRPSFKWPKLSIR